MYVNAGELNKRIEIFRKPEPEADGYLPAGAEPVPVLPGGFNPHKGVGVPLEEIGEWVNDALDLIEFANGGSDTVWGKIRKDLGHEAPFCLKMLHFKKHLTRSFLLKIA